MQLFEKTALSCPGPLLLRFFGGEVVVYNSLSAETHLINLAAGRLLEQILSCCSNFETLESILLGSVDGVQRGTVEELLQEYLTELESLGLIQTQVAGLSQ